MGQPLQPGELVIKRVRWQVDADLMGIVIGQDQEPVPRWLVLWTTGDRRVRFKWHLPDSLQVIDSQNVNELRSRCGLAS